MSDPDKLRDELRQLDDLTNEIANNQAPSMQIALEGLTRRRASIVSNLADAELAAVRLILDGADVVNADGVSVDFLVSILGPLQETISSVAQSIVATPTNRSSIPGEIRSATEMRLTDTFRGSFGLHLVGPHTQAEETALALFADETQAEPEEPVFVRAVERVMDAIALTGASLDEGTSDEEVLHALAGLGPRARVHLTKLAKEVARSGARAQIQFSRRGHDTESVEMSRPGAERLERVLEIVSQDTSTVKMTGTLVGAQLHRDRFDLMLDDDAETTISGSVAENVTVLMRELFGTRCIATLEVVRTESEVDATESLVYRLISLESIADTA